MRRRKWILTAVAAAMAAIACDAADVKDGAVQLRYDDSFQSWKLDIRVSAWDAQPGDTVTLEVAGQADVPLLAKHPEDWNSVQLVAWGERLYDERGRYRQQTNQFMSGFLTVSGIPVENTQYTPLVSLPGAVFTSPIEAHVDTGWDPRHAKRKLPISAAIPLVIPSDAPIGLYRTHVALLAEEKSTGRFLMLVDAAQATSARHKHPDILSFDATDALKMKSAVYHERFLPPIRIGDPDPRICPSRCSPIR
ncbi:MAG: hypothetical protein M5R36_14015 [Deltaproteobacteria bacterium]|nr:hypothetical protein [Deltaproteobacteria bacterium]